MLFPSRRPFGILLVFGLLIGCAHTPPVIVTSPEPITEAAVAIVEPPLPGIDSLVILNVSETFDSTFVVSGAEQRAQESYLQGQKLFDRVEELLAEIIGPSALPDSFLIRESNADTASFEVVNREARQALAGAAQAQLEMDSTTALALLGEAQQLFEHAVSMNPWHEEARYQLAQVYVIRANRFRESAAWDETLEILRDLVKLRANEHGLWAEIAIALENTDRPVASGLTWRQASEVVLDNSRLAFELTPPPVDSTLLFTYNVRAYRAFEDGRHGEGVRRSLEESWVYATTEEEKEFALNELSWAMWDSVGFENRLAFDSLRTVAADDPLGARAGIAALIPKLTRASAIRDAKYNYSVLSYDHGFQDEALDTLNNLWHDTMSALGDSLMATDHAAAYAFSRNEDSGTVAHFITMDPIPYPRFLEDLRSAYATFLFERALLHRRAGSSALAFSYLMQVAEIGSSLTGKAFIEALKLAKYNPRQALELETRVEEIYSTLEVEDQLAYLVQMGQHHRRLGNNDEATVFLQRYRQLHSSVLN